jgi:multiple sugar transport system substrate-binding protein
MTATAAVMALGLGAPASAADTKYNLLPNKPFAGKKLNILSVVTPQFDGLMLRDKEFTELTGIETEWTFIPFGSLQPMALTMSSTFSTAGDRPTATG